MRFVSMALFLFFIQLSAAIVNATIALDNAPQPQTDWINSQDFNTSDMKNQSYFKGSVSANLENFGFGDFITTLSDFFKIFFRAIFSVKFTLMQFGIQEGSALLFYIPKGVYIMYLLGIIQMIGNRATRSMR